MACACTCVHEYLFLCACSYICIAMCAWACKDLDFLEEEGVSGQEQGQAEPPFSSGPQTLPAASAARGALKNPHVSRKLCLAQPTPLLPTLPIPGVATTFQTGARSLSGLLAPSAKVSRRKQSPRVAGEARLGNHREAAFYGSPSHFLKN